MIKEEMNYEEKANTDKLLFYFEEKITVHIILKRKISDNKNVFINGLIVRNPNDRLWIIDDKKLGEIRISISEIAPWGVNQYKEEGR